MEACRGELTYTGRAIDSEESTFIVADAAGKIAGFIALLRLDVDTAELEGLFVDPDFIGYGIGKALMQQAIDCVASLNLKKIIIQADPNAARFYESVGAEACGERESVSIPGRMLPLYQLHL
jgi:GNAT superfamily N-acetyltransferase